MKERPILFSAPMVRALLDGSKTQTRRTAKSCHMVMDHGEDSSGQCINAGYIPCLPLCPYGHRGDRLWVRETFQKWPDGYAYRADYQDAELADSVHAPWKPSIHMPRAASRINLEITGVRVERLQDISRGDAMAEGCPFPNMAQGDDPRKWYADLWHSINGPDSWGLNPWVWVVEFKVMKS